MKMIKLLLLFLGIGSCIIFSSCQKELNFDKVPTIDSTRMLPATIVYNSASNDSLKLEYDNFNRISIIKKYYKDDLGVLHSDTITYVYDSNNQLIKSSAPFEGENWESTYTYNNLTITETITWLTHNPVDKNIYTYTLNTGKHLIKTDEQNLGITDCEYDNNGNQITSSFVKSSYDKAITQSSVYTQDSGMLRCVKSPVWLLESIEFFAPYIINNIASFHRETVTETMGQKETLVENGRFTYEMNKYGFPVLINQTVNTQTITQKITYTIAK